MQPTANKILLLDAFEILEGLSVDDDDIDRVDRIFFLHNGKKLNLKTKFERFKKKIIMFLKTKYESDKILVKLSRADEYSEVYEPIMRKLGGMWNRSLSGWIFDDNDRHEKLDEILYKYNSRMAEKENKEYYTKFSEEPDTYNTPSSSSSHNSASGLNEAFELIQELFDRVIELENQYSEIQKNLRMVESGMGGGVSGGLRRGK